MSWKEVTIYLIQVGGPTKACESYGYHEATERGYIEENYAAFRKKKDRDKAFKLMTPERVKAICWGNDGAPSWSRKAEIAVLRNEREEYCELPDGEDFQEFAEGTLDVSDDGVDALPEADKEDDFSDDEEEEDKDYPYQQK